MGLMEGDDMAERIIAGELEVPFTPPMTAAGGPAPRGSARGPITIEPIMVGSLWDQELVDDVPELGVIEGGSALLYTGTDHYVAGAKGSGKTYLALHLIVEQVRTDPTALAIYLDYESNVNRFIRRLRQIGTTHDEANRIAYMRPGGSLMKSSPYGRAWLAWAAENAPNLVVVDSVAVAMSAAGFEENSNDHATLWWYGAIEPLNALGITSLRIDHTGKDSMGKSPGDARGASAKGDRVDGAAYLFKADGTGWTKHHSGTATLSNIKDRSGEYGKGEIIAKMGVTVLASGSLDIKLRSVKAAPRNEDGTVRLTGLMHKISRTLDDLGPLSTSALHDELKGNKAMMLGSLETLLVEGYVTRADGQRGAKVYTSVRTYDQREDPLSDRYEGEHKGGPASFSATDPF